ncbi:MAG: tRNA-ribosyltransferase family protein [Chloroflexota bacterium]
MRNLTLAHGTLTFPTFLPDATVGVVRSVDALDLEQCGVTALVMNTFHLMQRPGSSTIQALGGLHRMACWDGPIMTDSGGFQAYSLIRQSPKQGRIGIDGITFQPQDAPRRYHLSPEKTVRLQLGYGADIVVCLDDCTNAAAPLADQEEAVQRTVEWARRCKAEFSRALDERRTPLEQRPRLFAVVQGGNLPSLRRACAEQLLAIGFDGYGFGGWPLDDQGKLLTEIIAYTRQLIGPQWPMHALGVGSPRNVAASVAAGYEMFDSALPTRDARQGRLYTWNCERLPPDAGQEGSWFSYLYINDKKHFRTPAPISLYCDCFCCRRYSTGYLHHLHSINDLLYARLATIHNLRFMTRLTELLRPQGAPSAD